MRGTECQPDPVSGTSEAPRSRRGFGSPYFNKERQRQIASLGGKAAHAKGVAHTWTIAAARTAGRKGGEATARAWRLKKAQQTGEQA